jgi:hypothetical protein
MESITMRSLSLLPALALVALAACSDGASPGNTAQVTFHVATRAGTAPGQALLSAPDSIFAGNDTLVFTQVELVIKHIRFSRVEDEACENETESTDLTGSSAALDDGGDDDACESFRTGPLLVDLPLGPGTDRIFSVAVDTGTYDQLRFKLHKPEDDGTDPADVQFLAAHPDFAGISIRARGTFNSVPFEWITDLSERQEQDLVPPLVITGGITNVDVTLKVDIHTWFMNGSALVDPATALTGGANEGLVRDNVRSSFQAFRDDDENGEDDGQEHDGQHD